MASETERTMTNTSPTALEEIRKRHAERQSGYDYDKEATGYQGVACGPQYHQDIRWLLNHIAALEAELADAVRARDEWETQSENQCRDRERYRDVLVLLCAAPPEITRKAMASVAYDTVFNLIPKDVAEFQLVERSKAEAQLATRLPDRCVLAQEVCRAMKKNPFERDGYGDPSVPGGFREFEAWEEFIDVADAILALLSGAATPTPTAALTEDDVWLKPPPHFIPDPRWQRQPQSNEEWNAHKDMDRQFNAKRRLAFAGDVDDPRAPKCMALVSRLDLSVVLGRLTWLEARFENTRRSALSSPPEPGAKSTPQGAEE